MKIRNGFVSNSSSSSFVMVGAYVNIDFSQEKMIEMMKEYDIEYNEKYPEDSFWDAIYNEEFGCVYYGEPGVLGKLIATDSDYSLDDTATDVEDLSNMVAEVEEFLDSLGEEDAIVKLITGTRAC